MSVIIIPFRVANIIYLESDEYNPASVFSLYIFMFNFVKIWYKYTYLDDPTVKYFHLKDNAIYLNSNSWSYV